MSKMTQEEKREYKNAQRQVNAIEERSSGYDESNYGVCSRCIYFAHREYEFGHKSYAACTHHHSDGLQRLHSAHRVTKCSDFSQRGQLSLESMWLIAKHIEVKNDKPIGFKLSDAEEYELDAIGEEYE